MDCIKKTVLFFSRKKAVLRSLAAQDSVVVLRGCGLLQHHVFMLHHAGTLLTHGHQAVLCSIRQFSAPVRVFSSSLPFVFYISPVLSFKGAKEVEHIMGSPLNENGYQTRALSGLQGVLQLSPWKSGLIAWKGNRPCPGSRIT